eukprot:403356923
MQAASAVIPSPCLSLHPVGAPYDQRHRTDDQKATTGNQKSTRIVMIESAEFYAHQYYYKSPMQLLLLIY